MKLLLLSALLAAASARNADGTSFCPDSYAELEWPNAKPGIVCRCVPAQDSSRDYGDCTGFENSRDCEDAFGDDAGNRCAWSVYDWSGDDLADSKPQNVDAGDGWVNEDGTVTDCNGNDFTADDCKYRNKSDCMAYLGDGICDFGQRFTRAGVRTGPNFACEKFGNDKGDCDCPDTLTCDGYCLDDNACAKEAYGFERCSDWFNDNVCDYGQRTSDFGVSMNFDCNIDASIANIPDLADMSHDHGFCDEWDWHTRYDKQTLLDNFAAECPEPQPTNEPTRTPTDVPSDNPTNSPEGDPCKEDVDCWCPSKIGQGDTAACCAEYPDYMDDEVCCANGGDFACDLGGDDCFADCGAISDRGDCEGCGFDHCIYNKKLPKGERCYERPVHQCSLRKDDGSWDKKTCSKAGDDGCFWAKGMGLKTVDIDDDGEPDEGTGMCLYAPHPCNTYVSSKTCIKKSAGKGLLCQWVGETCEEWADATCYDFKKKKDCVKAPLGCRYGKKGGKDKPKVGAPGGIDFGKINCYHWSDLCGIEHQMECPVCPDDDPNCNASKGIKYQKPPKVKKDKFKSCEKTGKDQESCEKWTKKQDCYWWDGAGEMKHDGDDNGEGCYKAGLSGER